MHSGFECTETEDTQASIITALADMLTLSKHIMSDGFKYPFYNCLLFYKI